MANDPSVTWTWMHTDRHVPDRLAPCMHACAAEGDDGGVMAAGCRHRRPVRRSCRRPFDLIALLGLRLLPP